MNRSAAGEVRREQPQGLARLRTALRSVAASARYAIPPALALFIAAVGWEVWVRLRDVPTYIVPAPSKVMGRLLSDLPFFAGEGAVTVSEALAGFALGSAVALTGATLMAHSRFLERSLLPLAILVKVTPIVAVAPLFVIWFGFGSAPKIMIAALITFFPVLVGGVAGFRSVDPRALDLLRSLKASRREVFLTLRVPSAMPYLFAGFRVSVPLAVIGAVVAEWFTGDRGLGSVIIVAHSNLDMPTLFSAIFTLAFIGISLTLIVSLIEKRVLFWHESSLPV